MQLNSLNIFWNMLISSSEMLTQSVLIFTDIQRLSKEFLIITRVQKKMGQCQNHIVIISQKI